MRIIIIGLVILIHCISCCKMQFSSVNNHTDYEIAINGHFQLELESNPTTGYSWQWKNKSSVSIVDTFNYQYIPSNPGLMGSGGIELWSFKGVRPGLDSIKLVYRRFWDSNFTVRTKTIVVRVK